MPFRLRSNRLCRLASPRTFHFFANYNDWRDRNKPALTCELQIRAGNYLVTSAFLRPFSSKRPEAERPAELFIVSFIPLRKLPESLPQCNLRRKPEITLQGGGISVGSRNIPRLHRNQLLVSLEVIILG